MASEWISVKDRLPDEEQDVLILIREIEFFGKHKEKRKAYHWIHTGWLIDGEWATTYCFGHKYITEEINDISELVVTHWMPLPKLPQLPLQDNKASDSTLVSGGISAESNENCHYCTLDEDLNCSQEWFKSPDGEISIGLCCGGAEVAIIFKSHNNTSTLVTSAKYCPYCGKQICI